MVWDKQVSFRQNAYSNSSLTSHKIYMIYTQNENSYLFLLVIWVNYRQLLYFK